MTTPNITVKLNELVKKGKEEIEACQEAVNKLTLVVNQNTARLNHNSALQKLQSTDRSTFSRLRSEFKDYVKTWENKEGDFAGWKKRLEDLEQEFNAEVSWHSCDSIANRGDSNWQCGSGAEGRGWSDPWEFYAYEDYKHWGGGPCYNRHVRCRRKDSNKNKIRDEYNAAKPKFSDWLRNKNKKPDISECRRSNWQCINKSDNSNKGTVRIGWGHTAGDGGWACNTWVDACKPDKCTATEIQDVEGKPGPVCKDGEANIDWARDTDDMNYPDNNQYPYNNQEPKFPDVQCCTNINAVAGTAQNIAQTCQQTMTNALKELESKPSSSTPASSSSTPASSSSTPASSSSTPASSTPASSTPAPSTSGASTSNNTAIIGGIVLIILLCICSFSGIIGFMFLGGEEA